MVEQVIKLKAENIRIIIEDEKELSEKHDISLEGAVIRCIKHVYRYGMFDMTKDIMIAILWQAMKGLHCKKEHLCVSQRLSLYEYLDGKEINDPYIKQFMKETKENHNIIEEKK